MNRNKESDNPIFDINDREYNCKAWYLKDTETEKGDALVEIHYQHKLLRKFIFPAYKIYNIAAHFHDIVDGELNNSPNGYEMAAFTGFGGSVAIKVIDDG